MKARKVRLEDGTLVRVQSVRAPRCGKLAYPSKKVAKAKAAEQRRNTGEMIRAYHCEDGCHAWHMGHPWGQRGKIVDVA